MYHELRKRGTRRRASAGTRATLLRCEGVVAALALLFAGCHVDFGRPRATIFSLNRPYWMGQEAASALGIPASFYPLTDDEILLRELAYGLINPPYTWDNWIVILGEYRRTWVLPYLNEVYDPAVYAGWLMAGPFRSATARYQQLIGDIRNDMVRMDQFVPVAYRVLGFDRKREQSFAYVTGLTPEELASAQARVAENAMIMAWVQKCLGNRASSYRYILERFVIGTPETPAVEAERTLTGLATKIANMYGGLTVAPVEASALAR